MKKPAYKKWWFWVLMVLAFFAVIGILTEDEPKVVDTVTSAETAAQEKTTFAVGETVELNNVRATLLSATSSYGKNFFTPTAGNVFVVCEFEIENNTDHDISVSTMLSFDTYFDGYAANLDLSATVFEGKTQLDGTIAAGKKMRGVVGYEAPEDWQEMEIHYAPSFWGNKEIIFTATRK